MPDKEKLRLRAEATRWKQENLESLHLGLITGDLSIDRGLTFFILVQNERSLAGQKALNDLLNCAKMAARRGK